MPSVYWCSQVIGCYHQADRKGQEGEFSFSVNGSTFSSKYLCDINSVLFSGRNKAEHDLHNENFPAENEKRWDDNDNEKYIFYQNQWSLWVTESYLRESRSQTCVVCQVHTVMFEHLHRIFRTLLNQCWIRQMTRLEMNLEQAFQNLKKHVRSTPLAVLVVDFFTKRQWLEASVLDNKFSETKQRHTQAEKEAFSSQLVLWEVCRFASGAIKIHYENWLQPAVSSVKDKLLDVFTPRIQRFRMKSEIFLLNHSHRRKQPDDS